jgi:hypothetical protein
MNEHVKDPLGTGTKTPKTYEVHSIANIFPLLDENSPTFKAFVEDIEKRGQQEAICLYEGKILDGRNRYLACQQLGLEPKTRVYLGDDPSGFVLGVNLHRRHLDESQRAMVGAKLANLGVGDNQHTKGGTSIDVASKLVNVGRASIDRARKVLSVGDLSLVAAVEQGNVSVSAAAQQVATGTDGGNSTVGTTGGDAGSSRKSRSDRVDGLVKRLVKVLKEWKKDNEDTAIAAASNLVDQLKAADLIVEEKKGKKAA